MGEFRVERKLFSISRAREWVRIIEKCGGFSTILDLTVEAVKWIVWKLNCLDWDKLKLSKFGSKSFREFDIVLSIKANRAGRFLSILCFHKTGARGRSVICCPLVLDSSKNFTLLEELRASLTPWVSTRTSSIQYKKKETGPFSSGFDFDKRKDCLQRMAVVLRADRNIVSWEEVVQEIQEVVPLEETFTVTAFANNLALAEFGSFSDSELVLQAEEFYLSTSNITMQRWHEDLGTEKHNLSDLRDRWVFAHGVPFHAISEKVFSTFCSNFGTFKHFRVETDSSSGLLVVKLWLEKCNTFKIPVVQNLEVSGKVFPVTLTLHLPSLSMCNGSAPLKHVNIAEVDCDNWITVTSKRRRRSADSCGSQTCVNDDEAQPRQICMGNSLHSIVVANPWEEGMHELNSELLLSPTVSSTQTAPSGETFLDEDINFVKSQNSAPSVLSLKEFSPRELDHTAEVTHVSDSMEVCPEPSWASVVKKFIFSNEDTSKLVVEDSMSENDMEDSNNMASWGQITDSESEEEGSDSIYSEAEANSGDTLSGVAINKPLRVLEVDLQTVSTLTEQRWDTIGQVTGFGSIDKGCNTKVLLRKINNRVEGDTRIRERSKKGRPAARFSGVSTSSDEF